MIVWGMCFLYDCLRSLFVSLKTMCLLEDVMKDEWWYHIRRVFFEKGIKARDQRQRLGSCEETRVYRPREGSDGDEALLKDHCQMSRLP